MVDEWENRANTGKRNRSSDSGVSESRTGKGNHFPPSEIDYTLTAGIDMCQGSLFMQPHTNSHMVAL